MNSRQFYETVKAMREAQTRAARTRSIAALSDSKMYEARVDAEIERVEKILEGKLPKQGSIFDSG